MAIVEKRSFVRVPFDSEAILKSRETLVRGSIKNLGLGGACIVTPEKIDLDSRMELEIILGEPASDLSVILNARVVRLPPEGIAVRFTGMYLDVFERLRDLIAATLGDRDRVIEEFLRFMRMNSAAIISN